MTDPRAPSLDVARRAARRVVLHSRVQMAVKAAIAATLAWFAAELVFSGEIQRYRYYAPLGAVVATYPTVATTVRHSVHAVVAIAVGGALGLAVHALLPASALALAIVVAVGVALAGLRVVGDHGSYVPVVAILVIVIGGSDPSVYALSYLALTLLGGLVGVAVGLAMPALRLTQGQEALESLETALAHQLDDLADGLRQHTRPGPKDWESRLRSVRPSLKRMLDSVEEAVEAQRGNPRARLRGYEADRQRTVGRALERVSELVEDLVEMLTETHREDRPSTPLDPELAEAAATALERLADIVRCYHAPISPRADLVVAGHDALQRLTDLFSRRRDLDATELAVLGAIVANLRRCLAAVLPAEEDETGLR